jgi:hypothetical protein
MKTPSAIVKDTDNPSRVESTERWSYIVFESSDDVGISYTPMRVSYDQANLLKEMCDISIRHKPMIGMVEEYILNKLRFEIFDEEQYISTFNPITE